MCLWVFGDYTSDITIEIDSEYINRRFPGGMVSIDKNSALAIQKGTVLCLRQGTLKYYVKIELDKDDSTQRYIKFNGGEKFSLKQSPTTTPPALESNDATYIDIPIKKINWGGGGVNLVNAIREISSEDKTKDIKLTVITNDFDANQHIDSMTAILDRLYPRGRGKKKSGLQWNEDLITQIADHLSHFTAEKALEIFLRKEGIHFHFIRVKGASDKINIVIAQVIGDKVTIKDKIILRGRDIELPASTKIDLSVNNPNTFVMLNSIKDKELFRKGMEAGVNASKNSGSIRGIIAMTDANQNYLTELMNINKKTERRNIASFNLIFNETEVVKFIERYIPKYADDLNRNGSRRSMSNGEIKQWIKERFYNNENEYDHERDFVILKNGNINFVLIKKIFGFIRDVVCNGIHNNIYITLGGYGSIGIDGNSNIFYVGTYPIRGLTIYDSTGCGDYWAAGITLLEYHHAKSMDAEKAKTAAKRNAMVGQAKLFMEEKINIGDYMKIASAIAFCKLTNPIGRVSLDDVLYNIKRNYIPSFRKEYDNWIPENIKVEEEIPPKNAEIAYRRILENMLG